MAVIIEQAHDIYTEKKVRLFELRRDRDCGFQFDVVEGKTVFQCKAAQKNFQYCLEHPWEYEDKGIVTQRESGWQEARAICECGKEIFLQGTYMGASQCGYCGRWHNLFGQELLPPESWDVSGCCVYE